MVCVPEFAFRVYLLEIFRRKCLINASNMLIWFCAVIVIELVMDKRTMQQLTEHFKFSS